MIAGQWLVVDRALAHYKLLPSAAAARELPVYTATTTTTTSLYSPCSQPNIFATHQKGEQISLALFVMEERRTFFISL